VNTAGILSVATIALVFSGCKVMNTGNSECEFRMHTDRERCLQNTESNERALQERRKEKRPADKHVASKVAEPSAESPYSMPRNDAKSLEGETYQPPNISLQRP
jgi:hypothetical protein